jgi:hypothetical protein
MFDNTTFSLASAVADSGTVTVGYPTGRSQGDYDWTPGKHVLFVAGNQYNAPADFTLTFNVNASDITLTNASGVAWPAQSACRLQIDRPGAEDRRIDNTAEGNDRVRQIPTQLALISLGSPDTADPNGYVESQDLTSAGVFSDDATAAAAIAAAALVGEADVPRNVVAAWTGTAVLTVTGTDEYGTVIVESSGSGTSLTGKKAFKTVTGISSSANITALTVGTGDVLGLPVKVLKAGQVLKEFKDGADEDATSAITTLTDSTGDSGTHNDTLADGSTVGAAITDNTTGAAATTWAAGAGVSILSFQFDLADIGADGELVTDLVVGYKFKILSTAAAVIDPVTTGSKAADFELDIGATPVTGGEVITTSALATPVGKVIVGETVTAANTGSASDTLTVRSANTTAYAEGKVELLIRIQNMDLADALAGIAAQHNLLRADSIVQNQNDSDLAQKIIELVTASNADRALTGTLVAGVGTEATATTGDVRGTYDPADAADGDDGYKLLVVLPNPTDKGVAQYGG